MRQRTISDSFWRDPRTSDLSQEEKATLLYYLTSPSSNIIGVYQIVWRIGAAEMGWTSEQLITVTERLQCKELIRFNHDGWIWVRVWWTHNSPAGAFSPKLRQNACKQIQAIPTDWRDEYLESLRVHGLDRVSIGYQSPIDTLRPNSSCIYNNNASNSANEQRGAGLAKAKEILGMP
ncbi:MAG TPA: hypothetical protein DCK83_00915 [Gallionellaceae bacterium]|nr:hypothetical protein [Gallionellaceae bacterium]